MLLKAAV